MKEKIRSMEEQMQELNDEVMESFLESYHRLLHEYDVSGGYTCVSEVTGVLKGLGFSEKEFDKPCGALSGGQKTRVSLARLLVTHPDIILLDEPTNHLDIESICWLESFLQNYKGAVVVVAHDRYFLDRVVTKVVEISLHRSSVYEGNYTFYAERAAKIREDRLKAYYNQQREIHRQEEVIEKLKSFNREKSVRRAESREKQLAKTEMIEKPMTEHSQMRITLAPSIISGKDVLGVEGLSKSFGEKVLFDDISFDIQRGERVALIGANGTGKTTILKILNQVIEADAGSFRLGTNVKIGYYDQEQQGLHMEKTLFDEISDEYPQMNQTRIRNVLASFLFTEDDVCKTVGDLSGGERGRLSLAKLMLSEANFLILDEPTNHLDITSKEILEDALNRYEGTVLFVSHDRYFINRTAMRILSLNRGQIFNYIGNYDYYLEKREETEPLIAAGRQISAAAMPMDSAAGGSDFRSESTPDPDSVAKTDWKTQKAELARVRRIQNRIVRLENEITGLEERLAQIGDEFVKPEIATNSARLNELHAEQTDLSEKLDVLYAEWEELSSE